MNVNIGYAWGQLMRARQTAAEHGDADVRARAKETVAKWESVIAGMQAGTIKVGSRTPTKAPAWVTLQVVTGGFATGGYSAGGPLRDHERALAAAQVVGRAYAGKYLVGKPDFRRGGGHKAAHMGHQGDERGLAQQRRFTAHVGPGENDHLLFVLVQEHVVGHIAFRPAAVPVRSRDGGRL